MKIVFLITFFSLLAVAQTTIPFERSKWTELKYNNFSPNKVEYLTDSLKVNVDSSASPLVYKLDQVLEVSSFDVILKINGDLPESKEFEDDSFFRLGLVVLGDNHLGAVGKLFAPKWAQELFKLAPDGAGLDKIYFFNIARSKNQLDKERINPASKYMFEKVIAVRDGEAQEVKYTLSKPLDTAALWISIDGDTTKSKFTTEIKSIKLNSIKIN